MQPISSYLFEQLRFDLRVGALGTTIKRGQFRELSSNLVVRIGDFDNSERILRNIFAYNRTTGGQAKYISASSAELLKTKLPDTVIARLRAGHILFVNSTGKQVSSLKFSLYDMALTLPAAPRFHLRGGGSERERTLPELIRTYSNEKNPAIQRNRALNGLTRRIVQLLSLFAIPPLCFGMAIPARRSANPFGLIGALAVYLIYNEFSIYGEHSASNGLINPLLGQVIPISLFILITVASFSARSTYTGSNMLARLGEVFGHFASRISLLVRPFLPRAFLRPSADAVQ